MINRFSHIKGKHIILIGLTFYAFSFLFGLLMPGVELKSGGTDTEILGHEDKCEIPNPEGFVKKIFFNNLGLNTIIIFGAFSMLTFSLIILSFNAIHIGFLIKGLYGKYGIKLALSLVLPHLIVEIMSHILSLYLAYLILREVIIPVIQGGPCISISLERIPQTIKILIAVIITTYLGAIIEVFITPSLI